jgi:biotin synthase
MHPDLDELLARAMAGRLSFTPRQIADLLDDADAGVWNEIFAAARAVKARCGKEETLKRALVECSNVCARDCFYCGIRASNRSLARYRLSVGEVGEAIAKAREQGYRAMAFQAGETESEENTRFYEQVLGLCGGMEVTLSLGEQSPETYRRWREAGAMRYLLRMETSNRKLFERLHPAAQKFDRRLEAFRELKRLGYVAGTGVMIGLPGQTALDLGEDVVFFGEVGADMVGMGPWIYHPASALAPDDGQSRARALDLSIKMVALVRLHLHGVNIVASSALAAIGGEGAIDRAIEAGANVVMPNFTPAARRQDYDLYPGKSKVQTKR